MYIIFEALPRALRTTVRAQFINCLLHKCEELSLILKTLIMSCVVARDCISRDEVVETGRPGAPGIPSKIRANKTPCFRREKKGRRKTPMSSGLYMYSGSNFFILFY